MSSTTYAGFRSREVRTFNLTTYDGSKAERSIMRMEKERSDDDDRKHEGFVVEVECNSSNHAVYSGVFFFHNKAPPFE